MFLAHTSLLFPGFDSVSGWLFLAWAALLRYTLQNRSWFKRPKIIHTILTSLNCANKHRYEDKSLSSHIRHEIRGLLQTRVLLSFQKIACPEKSEKRALGPVYVRFIHAPVLLLQAAWLVTAAASDGSPRHCLICQCGCEPCAIPASLVHLNAHTILARFIPHALSHDVRGDVCGASSLTLIDHATQVLLASTCGPGLHGNDGSD
jgi:hypothetical protein